MDVGCSETRSQPGRHCVPCEPLPGIRKATRSWVSASIYLDTLQNGDYENVQVGVPPSNDSALLLVPWHIRRPEYPEQSMGRDHNTMIKTSRDASIARALRSRPCQIADAGDQISCGT